MNKGMVLLKQERLINVEGRYAAHPTIMGCGSDARLVDYCGCYGARPERVNVS